MKPRYKHTALFCIASFLLVIMLGAALIPAGRVEAAGTTIPRNVKFETVTGGLSSPLFVTHAGDGSNRLFILERTGKIRIYKNGALNATPFLDVSALINTTGGEQGLLGLAFAPDYASSGRFYIVYVKQGVNTIALARYQVSANPDVADPASRHGLLTISKNYANHNGGMLAFGPDGYLYMGVGDGGSSGDPDGNAQNKNVLLGKLLRLDVSAAAYSIPASNPFVGQVNVRTEIWSYGLRNPWRFSFDRLTGDLYIGDVGQNSQEEIDFRPSTSPGGENYGWNILEGSLCYPTAPCSMPSGYVPPVWVYDHGLQDSVGCSVTGGYVYRGSSFTALQGAYLYADFCTGRVWGLKRDAGSSWNNIQIADTDFMISSFGEDQQGELYLTDYHGGRLIHVAEAPIVTARFSSNATYDGSVQESARNSSSGGLIDSTGTKISLGDLKSSRQVLGILSFNTRDLPDNAVILAARLRFRKMSVTGIDPFTTLAPLQADIRTGFFGSSTALESGDFQAAATRTSIAGSTLSLADNFYILGLSRGKPYINRIGVTQLRLYFSIPDNNNSSADLARIASGDSLVGGDKPKLILEYYVP